MLPPFLRITKFLIISRSSMFNLKFIFLLTLTNVVFNQFAIAESGGNIQLGPENFSHTAIINISDPNASMATIRLPQWSYLVSRHQLLDLRVFNGENIAVSHQLSPLQKEGRRHEFSVNAIAIPSEAKDEEVLARTADVNLDIKGKVDIHLSQQPAIAKTQSQAKVNQWIIDDSKLAITAIDQFRFEIAGAKNADFVADISVETSGDLRSWQSIVSHQKILSYSKQRLAQLGISIQPTKARYWRVVSNGEDISRIAKIYVSAPPQMEEVYESLTLECQMNGSRDKIVCPFEKAQLPVTAVLFDFGKQHVAFNAQILAYDKMPQFDDAKATLQPIQVVDTLLTSTEMIAISLNRSPITALLITAQQGGKLGIKKAPKINLKWQAQQLKFLMHGQAPFTLAIGSEVLDKNTEQMLDDKGSISSGLMIDDPVVKEPITITKVNEKKRPWLLWGLLGFAVLSLSWMAVSLLRQK